MIIGTLRKDVLDDVLFVCFYFSPIFLFPNISMLLLTLTSSKTWCGRTLTNLPLRRCNITRIKPIIPKRWHIVYVVMHLKCLRGGLIIVLPLDSHDFHWDTWFHHGLVTHCWWYWHILLSSHELSHPQTKPYPKLPCETEMFRRTNEWGELTGSYRWTGWVWKITSWSSKTSRNSSIHAEEFIELFFHSLKKNRKMLKCN